MEEEESIDFDTGISVITVVMDNTQLAPRIDLHDVPPHVAIAIFTRAIEALQELIPFPTIDYQGKTVISDMYINGDDEFGD